MSLDPNWILAVCAILGLASGGFVAFWRISVRLHAVTAPIHDVRNQVQNDHETNLREDIDEIREMLSNVLSEQVKHATAQAVTTTEVKGLRRDVERLEDRLNRA